MTQEEILEGNKLIKNFMETDQFEYDSWGVDQLTEGKYHLSWDWLIPAIDQIKCLNVEEYTLIDKIDNALVLCDIENTFKAVVNFINWYNKNKDDK